MTNLRQTVTQVLSHLEIRTQSEQEEAVAEEEPVLAATGTDGPPARAPRRPRGGAAVAAVGGGAAASGGGQGRSGKVPRNAPCPCGSGKKYKHCHGKL